MVYGTNLQSNVVKWCDEEMLFIVGFDVMQAWNDVMCDEK